MKLGQYDVGYRKLPTANRFVKGRSGNPKGKPRTSALGLDESIERKLDKLVWIERDGRREAVTMRELGIITLLARALSGDPKAFAKVFKLIRQMEPPREKKPYEVVYVPDSPDWAAPVDNDEEGKGGSDGKKGQAPSGEISSD